MIGILLFLIQVAPSNDPQPSETTQPPIAVTKVVDVIAPKGGASAHLSVDEILSKWEAASKDIKTARIRFTRTTYETAFEVERIGEGELLYESPNKFHFIVRPLPVTPEKKGARLGNAGQPFRLEPERAETVILNSDEMLVLNDEAKQYERISGQSTISFFSRPLFEENLRSLFLVDVNAAQIRERWRVKFDSQKDQSLIITTTSKAPELTSHWNQCFIMIDRQTWQMQAVKVFSNISNVEAVYKIDGRGLNQPLPDNCFSPDLSKLGYANANPPK